MSKHAEYARQVAIQECQEMALLGITSPEAIKQFLLAKHPAKVIAFMNESMKEAKKEDKKKEVTKRKKSRKKVDLK